jgi:hypothetical protein
MHISLLLLLLEQPAHAAMGLMLCICWPFALLLRKKLPAGAARR